MHFAEQQISANRRDSKVTIEMHFEHPLFIMFKATTYDNEIIPEWIPRNCDTEGIAEQ